ncbi:MAG: hypothetical protein RBS51_02945 [Anaerovoracaceae bacterium]|nr:hypothetical protein [Anaerovoracaceae bacterium]
MPENKKSRQPFMLMKNVVYPTYQLHAFTSNKQTPSEDAFKIIVLEIMSWLRERFRALDVPHEIKLPDPGDYEKISLSELKSFHIDSGYILEVIFLEEEKTWAMQLVEPDLGPNPGRTSQVRLPAPGRMFFTNIGLAMKANTVEIGINVQVSELENEEIPCEVFRIGVVKRLARNPKIGLEQEFKYKIRENPYIIETLGDIGKLKNLIQAEERQLPVLVISEPGEKTLLSHENPAILAQRVENLSRPIYPVTEKLNILSDYSQAKKCPILAEDLSETMMGYAYTFSLPYSFYDEFASSEEVSLEAGGICVYYPSLFGGYKEKYRYGDISQNPEMIYKLLESNVQEFLKRKTIKFGEVKFLRQLKQKEMENMLLSAKQHGEGQEIYLKEMEDYKRLRDQKLAEARGEFDQIISALEKDKEKLSNRISQLEERSTKEAIVVEDLGILNDEVTALREENAKLKEQIEKLNRPNKTTEIPKWVEECFSDRLILHEKAVELITSTPTSEVDMTLLCDALEYLSKEYRDELLGKITEEERNSICSKRYDRPFTVTPITGMAPNAYPLEYKIKYYRDERGKKHESVLDLHLKSGTGTENLLRIYFLYDKEKQLIVVGSLPKHLKTLKNG